MYPFYQVLFRSLNYYYDKIKMYFLYEEVLW